LAWRPDSLSTLETKISATVTENDSLQIRRQSPFSVTVAEIGDYSLQCGQGLRLTLRYGNATKPNMQLLNSVIMPVHKESRNNR